MNSNETVFSFLLFFQSRAIDEVTTLITAGVIEDFYWFRFRFIYYIKIDQFSLDTLTDSDLIESVQNRSLPSTNLW